MIKRVLSYFIVLLISGCSSQIENTQIVPLDTLWQQHQQHVAQLTHWGLKGRSSIYQNDNGGTLSVRWQQDGENFNIVLTGPFYQGGAELQGNNTLTSMTLDDGKTYKAATPEILIAKTMGKIVPVSALRDWVRGLPYAKLPTDSYDLDDKGRLKHISQAGWKVQFFRYIRYGDYVLPNKIFINKDDIKIKLIISDWSGIE